MKLSPFGALAHGIYDRKFGFGTLFVLGKLMACFYIPAAFIFIVLNGICRFYDFVYETAIYIRMNPDCICCEQQ